MLACSSNCPEKESQYPKTDLEKVASKLMIALQFHLLYVYNFFTKLKFQLNLILN